MILHFYIFTGVCQSFCPQGKCSFFGGGGWVGIEGIGISGEWDLVSKGVGIPGGGRYSRSTDIYWWSQVGSTHPTGMHSFPCSYCETEISRLFIVVKIICPELIFNNIYLKSEIIT